MYASNSNIHNNIFKKIKIIKEIGNSKKYIAIKAQNHKNQNSMKIFSKIKAKMKNFLNISKI